MSEFDDLTPEKALQYVREKTDLFLPEEPLFVHEINHEEGGGYVNHLYKIWNEDKAVVIKQAKPYLNFLGTGEEAVSVTVDRIHTELDAYHIRSSIVPEYLLKILHEDAGHHLFIQEFSNAQPIRLKLRDGQPFPHFSQQIGDYIARSAFYTSEFFLDQEEHKLLGAKFVNTPMRRIMEGVLFEFQKFGSIRQIDDFLKDHYDFTPFMMADRQFYLELLSLREIYMRKGECLVHGDLHTSNIISQKDRLIVFDFEYAHLGSFSSDLGYLCGNLLYPYVSRLFRLSDNNVEKRKYSQEILQYIAGIIDHFDISFRKYWMKDAKDRFKNYPEYIDIIFENLIAEIAGFMGIQGIVRTAHQNGAQDFETLHSHKDLEEARTLMIALSLSLVKSRRKFRTIQQIISTIQEVTEYFFIAVSRH